MCIRDRIKSLRYDYYCKLTYDLPELMRNITTEGGIFDRDNNKVGTVTCENRKITVIFLSLIHILQHRE